jgi:hypothetical protein
VPDDPVADPELIRTDELVLRFDHEPTEDQLPFVFILSKAYEATILVVP